jgi:hypothetical protein
MLADSIVGLTIGPIGKQGIQGAQGPQGIQGPQGNPGINGAQGLQGVPGNQGTTGAQGAQGNQGATGSQGLQGQQGLQGATGQNGSNGATGATGQQGNQGPQGVQGTPGAAGQLGSTGAVGATGPTGPAGSNGTNGATGAVGPTGSVGATGVGFGTQTINQPGVASGPPTRVLGTAFQPSATQPCFVSYRAKVSATLPLLGTAQEGRVRMRVGPTATTTVEWPGAVGILKSATAAVTVSQTDQGEGTLYGLIPVGWWVMLDAVTVSGTPTLALISNATLLGAQIEQVLA